MRRRLAGALAGAGAALLAASPALAAPGQLDPSFGSGGIATTPFGAAAGVARGPDGRLAITGGSGDGRTVLTARFLGSGALDGSFAGTGSRLDSFGVQDGPHGGGAVAVQPDGSVVGAGVAITSWLLARYRPDGSPDVLFGAGGATLRSPSGESEFPGYSGPHAIAIAADGRIVVAGSSGVATPDAVPSERIVVGRYSALGVPDPGFGKDGFATIQLGRSSKNRHAESTASALALLADGRVVIAGASSDRYGADRGFVARLTAAGALDGTFASAGRRLVQLGTQSAARRASSAFTGLAVRSDGTLLAAGRATDVAGRDAVALARFSAAGAADRTFGRDGAVISQLGAATKTSAPRSRAHALSIAPGGGALIAGDASGRVLAARFDSATGRLDCGFGARGRTLLPAGTAASALTQPDGALVLAGQRTGGGVLLARLLGGTQAPPAARTPRLVTLGVRATKSGSGYAYGYVDSRCVAARVRFAIFRSSSSRPRLTRTQVVRAGYGPQVVCVRISGVRAGRRIRLRMQSKGPGGSMRERSILRAVAGSATFAQHGCVG